MTNPGIIAFHRLLPKPVSLLDQSTAFCPAYSLDQSDSYLEMLVDTCVKGMLDTNNQVVQVSYFALCQFSEYLQVRPNIVQSRITGVLSHSLTLASLKAQSPQILQPHHATADSEHGVKGGTSDHQPIDREILRRSAIILRESG